MCTPSAHAPKILIPPCLETLLCALGGRHAGDSSYMFFPDGKSHRVSLSPLCRADHMEKF